MQVLTFNSLSGSQVKWTADRDVTVRYVGTWSNSAVFSLNPQLTYAASIAPTGDGTDDAWILVPNIFAQVEFFIAKNTTIYCAFNQATSVAFLLIDEVFSLK